MDIYGICSACKAIMAFPDDGKAYSCIACQVHPPLLRTTDLFKACGEITEGTPRAMLMELMLLLQGAIRNEMSKDDDK